MLSVYGGYVLFNLRNIDKKKQLAETEVAVAEAEAG